MTHHTHAPSHAPSAAGAQPHPATQIQAQTVAAPAPTSRRYVLIMLTALSALTFMDRQVLAVLLEPIKQEFGFTDLQIGLISGLGFALTFGVLGLPLGRLADRCERRSLIAWTRGIGGCIAISGAWASGLGGLMVSRAGAALSDAGGGAASMSILADLYAPSERSRVMSVFGVGATSGALLALLLAPLFASWWGWRGTLAVIGGALLLLSVVLRFSTTEPLRTMAHRPAAQAHATASAAPRSAVAQIWAEPVTRWLIVGASCALLAGLSIGAWNVALLVRRFDFSLTQAGWLSALAALLSLLGSLFAGWLTDRLARHDVRWQIRIPVLGVGVAMLSGLAYLSLSNDWLWPALACMLVYAFFTAWWGPATYAALSLVVPAYRRATASAMVLMAGALLGNGLGPIAAGWLSDALNPLLQGQGLRGALLLMMGMLLPGFWAFVQALRHYPQALEQAQRLYASTPDTAAGAAASAAPTDATATPAPAPAPAPIEPATPATPVAPVTRASTSHPASHSSTPS